MEWVKKIFGLNNNPSNTVDWDQRGNRNDLLKEPTDGGSYYFNSPMVTEVPGGSNSPRDQMLKSPDSQTESYADSFGFNSAIAEFPSPNFHKFFDDSFPSPFGFFSMSPFFSIFDELHRSFEEHTLRGLPGGDMKDEWAGRTDSDSVRNDMLHEPPSQRFSNPLLNLPNSFPDDRATRSFSSRSFSRIIRPDGSIEERRTYRDSSGKEEVTVTEILPEIDSK